MPHTRTDRAARARDKRRKQLLNAATRVFARKGYWSSSIADIIQAAGVARGTFYLYFCSKRDVFLAIADNYREEQKRFTRQSGAGQAPLTPNNSRARIRADFLGWLEFYRRNLDAANIVLRDATRIDPSAVRKREKLVRHGAYAGTSESHELADVFLYVVHMANVLGLDLAGIVREKEFINVEKFLAR